MIFSVKKEDRYKIGVYCISNSINGKIYIGSTGNSFYNRYHQHISDYKKRKHNGIVLKRAFDKYGISNFIFSVVCICQEANRLKMEQFYINKGVDYNSAMIAGSMMGYRHSDNSKTRTVKGRNHHSAKEVDQYSIDGNFLKSFGCVGDAADSVGLVSKSGILQYCKGMVFSAKGFRWAYKCEKLINRPNRLGKCRVSVEKDGICLEFDSQGEAANYLKAKQGSICNAIRLNNKLYGYVIKKI